jgi:hypothetical protein
MNRTLLAVSSVIAAAVAYGAPAQACISCSYTPEVLKSGSASGGSSSSTYHAAPSKRVRDYTEQRERRATKKREVTTREPEAKKPVREAAKPAPEKTTTATASASTENSAITTNGQAIANHVKAAAVAGSSELQTENSTISSPASSATASPSAKPVTQATADKSVGCKKYFASTGLTLTVPCE